MSKKVPLKKKGKGKVLVPKWKLFRAKEPLLSVFMWGVNHSVSLSFYAFWFLRLHFAKTGEFLHQVQYRDQRGFNWTVENFVNSLTRILDG